MHLKLSLMRLFKSFVLVAISFMASLSINAQVTTSSMAGTVRSTAGEALSGASVKVTHMPTGTTITAATSANGRFNVSNIQPGGPYTVEVSFVGYKAQTKTDIFLDLGETGKVDFSMVSNSQDLKGYTVCEWWCWNFNRRRQTTKSPHCRKKPYRLHPSYSTGQNYIWWWYIHCRSKQQVQSNHV